MVVDTRILAEVTLIDLPSGFQSADVQEVANSCLAQGSKKIAVNLAQVNFIESSGLGALVNLFKFCQAQGARVVFFGLQSYVQKLFEITRLHNVLTVVDTEPQALEKLSS